MVKIRATDWSDAEVTVSARPADRVKALGLLGRVGELDTQRQEVQHTGKVTLVVKRESRRDRN